MQNDDDFLTRLSLQAHRLEVIFLRVIDGFVEREVDTPKPPAVRQRQRKITAALLGLPSADLDTFALGEAIASRTEHAREGRETVIPVVIASDEKQLTFGGLPFLQLERGIVGFDAARAVFFDGGVGIGHVAAHDHDIAGGQHEVGCFVSLIRILQRNRRLSHQIGHRVCRLEAIAKIGDKVDLQRVIGIER